LTVWALFACLARLNAGVEYFTLSTGNEYWYNINSSKQMCAEVVTSGFLGGEVLIEFFSLAFRKGVNGHTRLCVRFPLLTFRALVGRRDAAG